MLSCAVSKLHWLTASENETNTCQSQDHPPAGHHEVSLSAEEMSASILDEEEEEENFHFCSVHFHTLNAQSALEE